MYKLLCIVQVKHRALQRGYAQSIDFSLNLPLDRVRPHHVPGRESVGGFSVAPQQGRQCRVDDRSTSNPPAGDGPSSRWFDRVRTGLEKWTGHARRRGRRRGGRWMRLRTARAIVAGPPVIARNWHPGRSDARWLLILTGGDAVKRGETVGASRAASPIRRAGATSRPLDHSRPAVARSRRTSLGSRAASR